jgi:hypothetical protein
MGKKGISSARGVGEIWDEPKSEQVMVLLTRSGRGMLDSLAWSHGLSRSELIEQIARREMVVIPKPSSASWFSRPSQIQRLIFTFARSYIRPKS